MEDLLKIIIAGLGTIITALVGAIVTLIKKWEKKLQAKEQEHQVKVKELTNGWRLSLQSKQQRLETAVAKLETKIYISKECCKKNA